MVEIAHDGRVAATSHPSLIMTCILAETRDRLLFAASSSKALRLEFPHYVEYRVNIFCAC